MKSIIKNSLAVLLLLASGDLCAADDADMRGAGAPAGGSELVHRRGAVPADAGEDVAMTKASSDKLTPAQTAKFHELCKAFVDNKVTGAKYDGEELRIFTEDKPAGDTVVGGIAIALLVALYPMQSLARNYLNDFVLTKEYCEDHGTEFSSDWTCYPAGTPTTSWDNDSRGTIKLIVILLMIYLAKHYYSSRRYIAAAEADTLSAILCNVEGLSATREKASCCSRFSPLKAAEDLRGRRIKWSEIINVELRQTASGSYDFESAHIFVRTKSGNIIIETPHLHNRNSIITFINGFLASIRGDHTHDYGWNNICKECGETKNNQ